MSAQPVGGVLAVDGVVSAEFDRGDVFGGGWQRGAVVLRASSRGEVVRVVDALSRAFTAVPDVGEVRHSRASRRPPQVPGRSERLRASRSARARRPSSRCGS
ncbi:hypothetical protein GCM10022245_16800 [Streptomyces mayteni]